jgi:hypothetical protein
MHLCWRARFAWIAIVAVLNNALLPSAIAVGVGRLGTDSSGIRLGLCSAIPARDTPAKTKPALIVHHCALCAAAQHVLLPSRQAVLASPLVIVGETSSIRGTTGPNASPRRCRAQPRAPPS